MIFNFFSSISTIAMLSLVSTTPLRAIDQLLTPVGETNRVSPIFLDRFSVRTIFGVSTSSIESVALGSEYLYSTSISFWRLFMMLFATSLSDTVITASAVEGMTFLLVPPLILLILYPGILFKALPRSLMALALSLCISPPECPPRRLETLILTLSPSAVSHLHFLSPTTSMPPAHPM